MGNTEVIEAIFQRIAFRSELKTMSIAVKILEVFNGLLGVKFPFARIGRL
jgi:hypothetical protein